MAGAKRNVDAALHTDPKFWPALYRRAEIFAWQGQYQLAIADCNEALRQYPGFVEASFCVPPSTRILGNTRKR